VTLLPDGFFDRDSRLGGSISQMFVRSFSGAWSRNAPIPCSRNYQTATTRPRIGYWYESSSDSNEPLRGRIRIGGFVRKAHPHAHSQSFVSSYTAAA